MYIAHGGGGFQCSYFSSTEFLTSLHFHFNRTNKIYDHSTYRKCKPHLQKINTEHTVLRNKLNVHSGGHLYNMGDFYFLF